MPVAFRLAIRTLGNAPQFSAVALIVLALGLGANAAIFSVVNSVLLQPLPFRDADRLVLLSTTRLQDAGIPLPFSLPELGGRPRDIASLLVGDGMRLTLIGLGLGLGAAVVVGRAMTGLLVGVTAADPLTLAAAGVFVSAVAFAACYIPARRAMRLDPSVVLRR